MKHASAATVVALAVLCALLLGVLAAAGSARAAPAHAGPPAKTWTVALYANGDNDLMYTWPRFTLPALERIPASAGVNVVAMLDRPRRNGAWLYRVSGGRVATVKHYTAERDFGAGRTFEWFLRQVHTRFPSEHLVVIGWDHGYGWRYFSRDFTSHDRITMPELRAALTRAGVYVDVLAFDACNMGAAEVAYDVASTGQVGYLVASEETIDQDGYPYDSMFTPLALDPGRSTQALLGDMLGGWQRYYGVLRCFNWVSLSAVELAPLSAATADLRDWVAQLRAGMPANAARYQAALGASIYAWDSWLVDLGQFAANLAADPQLDQPLKEASARVRDDVAASVRGVTSGSYATWFRGLTVWAGTGADWTEGRAAYRRQVAFAGPAAVGGVGWHGFLREFNASGQARVKKPDPRPPRASYGLTDVYFADLRHGWATGYNNVTNNALILRTADGGLTWKRKSRPAWYAYMFSALAPAPGGKLWAVGSEGWAGSLLARSANSGVSWPLRASGTKEYLLGVDAVGAANGWICGTGRTLLRSSDSGKTWKRARSAPAGDLLGLDFTDARRGWVLANDLARGAAAVVYTSDAGAHWATEMTVPDRLLYAVDVVDGHEVWAVGGTTGGAAGGGGAVFHGAAAGAWEQQWGAPVAPRLNDIFMVDATHGWAVGDDGVVIRTNDGVAWTPQESTVGFDLAAIYATDEYHAWAVGDGEGVLVTSDGGETWRRQ